VPDDTVDLSRLSARELLYRGHALLNANRVEAATTAIFTVCERYSAADEPVPPTVLSLYALCLARQGKRKEAVDTCRMALKREPRNPTCRLHMARIYLLANARRKAFEELERGLSFSPENQDLRRFEAEMGKRKPPVLGFLSRDNPINVKLGKARAGKRRPS
jgi:predicted Zn-dependent protease